MGRNSLRRWALLGVLTLTTTIGVAGAPAQASLATGGISGRVVSASGEPAGNVGITARRANGPSAFTSTAADGTYRLDNLQPGEYVLQLEPTSGVRQYAHQKRFGHLADVFTVADGQQVVVDETLLPRGNMAGRFVDFDGTPIAGAWVGVQDLDGESYANTRTDAAGNWRIDGLFTGRYRVRFNHEDTIAQAAFGKVGVAQPDVITVAANATTTVNDTAIARTSVRITATDARTGAPIASFGASIGQRYAYTESGELIVDRVQAGTYDTDIYADGYFPARPRITLTAGQQAELAVALQPQSYITAKVVDAATGEPVPNFCVGAFTLTNAVVPDSLCGEQTDEAGNVRIGWLRAGSYRLFATPGYQAAPGYGAQWVGANGGTGRQLLAQSFSVGTGETVTGPVIKLDRAGTITGRVSTADGQAPTFGEVGVLTGHPISGTGLGVPIAADGTYKLDFLGPYDWPLLFEARDQAAQWSGNVGDRHFARTVKVNSGATTTYDFRFRAAVNVVVKVQGLPSGVSWLLVHNAVTGDLMGASGDNPTNEISLRLVGPQLVKLHVWPSDGDPRWAGGADFAHAQPYWIPASGSKTITVTF